MYTIFYKRFIDYYVIFEICLIASKSARMRWSAHLKAVAVLGTLVPQRLVNILFVPSVRSGNSCGTHSRKAAFTTTRVGAQVRLRGWRFSSKSLASRRTPILRESHSPTCARLPSPSGSTRKRRGW